jgi:hypothetical protein
VAISFALLIAANLASAAQTADTIPRAVPSPYAWTPHSDELPSDPHQVAEVAIGDPDPYRRLAAIAALCNDAVHNQPELVRVVARAPDVNVRRGAIAVVTDAAAIATALVRDADPLVRARAATRCRDRQALLRAALSDRDFGVAQTALGALIRPGDIVEVAARALNPDIRQRAVWRLSDPRVQAREAPSPSLVRRVTEVADTTPTRALILLTAPDARPDIALGMPRGVQRDEFVRALDVRSCRAILQRAATDRELALAAALCLFDREHDQVTLAEAVRVAPAGPLLSAALIRIDRPDILADLALRGTDAGLRLAASGKLTSLNDVMGVHAASSDPKVRRSLEQTIPTLEVVLGCRAFTPTPGIPAPSPTADSEDALLLRAKGGTSIAERTEAIRLLTRQDTLFALATSDPLPEVRAAAAATLTDAELIRQVLQRETDQRVRAAAITRFTDQPALTDLTRRDPSSLVRRTALCNVRDRAVWEDRLAHDQDADVRALAARVLGVVEPR